MSTNLLIVGASARAAAMSAKLCGYELWCADRFNDVDLQAIAETALCEKYPDDLPRLMSDAPSGPWIYTGALENRPDLLEAMITRRHPLLGNAPDVVRAIRDPVQWTAVLKQAGLPTTEILTQPAEVPVGHWWLQKPRKSGSGAKIREWNEAAVAAFTPDSTPDYFWQKYVVGIPIASIYVAARRTAVLLGTTRQLIPEAWQAGEAADARKDSPRKYHYCGSVGPLHLEDPLTEQLQAIGETLAREFGLRGLFGVDAILDLSDQRIVPVEINPRYTASIEVLERASIIGTQGTRGKALQSIRLHVEACEQEKLPDRVLPATNAKVEKAILYVPDDFPEGGRFPSALAQWAAVRNLSSSHLVVADIPQAESPLVAGQPMMTLLEQGENLTDEIEVQAAEVYEILREWNQ